jgi:hypothetical protein
VNTPGLTLGEGHNAHRHLHRGPPAWVGSVELRLEASAPHTVGGDSLVLLHAHGSEPEGSWPDRKELSIVESWWTAEGQPLLRSPQKLDSPLILSPGDRGALRLTFARELLYQVYDRWAVDVTLLVDGQRQVVRVPLRVVRVEPRDRSDQR